MAEGRFRPPKTSEQEEKCVATAEVTCAFSVIKFLTSVPFRSEVYSKVESEHEVAIIEREFKFRKRMAFSVFGFFKNCSVTFNVSGE